MTRGRTLSFTALLLLLFSYACASSSPYGPKAAIYSGNELSVTYNNTFYRTFEGSGDALRDLGMTITEAQKTAERGLIRASTPEGTDVLLSVTATKPDITDVNIKVGTYGDERLSREISRKIQDRV